MKNFLAAIFLCPFILTAANAAEEDYSQPVDAALYSEATAREFAVFNLAFGCSVARDKFYSRLYKKSIVETCVDEVESTSDEIKDKLFRGAVDKDPTQKIQTYSMFDMLIVGKYHFILGCYSAHLTARNGDRSAEETLVKDCTDLSAMITPLLVQNFAEHKQKKKTT